MDALVLVAHVLVRESLVREGNGGLMVRARLKNPLR